MLKSSEFIERSLTAIHSSPVECLRDILALTCEQLRCDYGAILTVDRHANLLRLEVLHGYLPADALEHRSERLKFPFEKGWLAAKALVEAEKNGSPVPVTGTISEPDKLAIIPTDVKGLLAYAIENMGEHVAVLTLGSTNESAFTRFIDSPEEKHLLGVCSKLISLALVSRRSVVFNFDELIKRGEFDDFSSLSKAAIDWVLNTFKVNSCALYLVDYDDQKGEDYLFCCESVVDGVPGPSGRDIRYMIGEGYCGWIVTNGACLILSDFENDDSKELDYYERRYKNRPKRTGQFRLEHPITEYKSYLGVPITDGNRVIGVLEVLDTEREYALVDEGLLEMIGNRIASEYNRIAKDLRRENLLEIPNIETRDLKLVIEGVVLAAINVTSATHGFFQFKEVDDRFTPRAVRGFALRDSDIATIHPKQQTLTNYVINNHKAFICQNIKKADFISSEMAFYLDNSLMPSGFIPERIISLLMVPVYLKDLTVENPRTQTNGDEVFEDLGVLVLMSSRENAFRQDEVIITALAEIVSYHIWGNKKLAELDADRKQVAELREAMQNYQQAVMSAAASAGTVHSAKKHIAEISGAIEKLIKHEHIRRDNELLDLARQINTPFQELSLLYDRLHSIYSGAEPAFRPCDIADLVQQVRSYMEPTFRERNIQFINAINHSELPKVMADDILMKVVFINLIRNSIEANARKITVQAKKTTMGVQGTDPKDAIEVTFKDDGIGIPRENWTNIFNIFVTANKKGGSGVGLTVNRNIINKHQGKIRVVSSTVGEGTTIAVIWPIELP